MEEPLRDALRDGVGGLPHDHPSTIRGASPEYSISISFKVNKSYLLPPPSILIKPHPIQTPSGPHLSLQLQKLGPQSVGSTAQLCVGGRHIPLHGWGGGEGREV